MDKPKKEFVELRIMFSVPAMERLKRQCALLDVPPSTWVRALVMEKITAFEAVSANAMMHPMMLSLSDFVGKMGEEMEDFRRSKLEDSRKR